MAATQTPSRTSSPSPSSRASSARARRRSSTASSRSDHGEKIAVIENEFGETGVDNEILVKDKDEQIVEMNNGCLCCTVRGDLVRILGDLGQKRSKGKLKFDRVIIETTGLANPGPVAQTFFMDEAIHDQYLLDAVVTVVDAKHADKTLDDHDEARRQVGFADRILLSKTDLVDDDGKVDELMQRLRQMNPRAHAEEGPHGQRGHQGDPRHPRLQPERGARARSGVPRRATTTSTTTR